MEDVTNLPEQQPCLSAQAAPLPACAGTTMLGEDHDHDHDQDQEHSPTTTTTTTTTSSTSSSSKKRGRPTAKTEPSVRAPRAPAAPVVIREGLSRASKVQALDTLSLAVLAEQGDERRPKGGRRGKGKAQGGGEKRPSAAHYAMYADNDEPIELIMERFAKMERIKEARAAALMQMNENVENHAGSTMTTAGEGAADAAAGTTTTTTTTTTSATTTTTSGSASAAAAATATAAASADGADFELSEKDLEQLFNETTFEPLSHILKESSHYSGGSLDTRGDWLVEFDSDSDSSGWTAEDSESSGEGRPRKRGRKERDPNKPRKEPREGGSRRERRVVTTQGVDEGGRTVVLKRRVKFVDPNLPTLVKLPPTPIPRTWSKIVRPWAPPVAAPDAKCRFIATESLVDFDLSSLNTEYEGILMDPPWRSSEGAQHPGAVTAQDLAKLGRHIDDKLVPFGLLFMWADKELVPDVLALAKSWRFEYVEHFAAVHRNVNNKFATHPTGKLFSKTKNTLLIFRKKKCDPDPLELRHQRNPDVTFEWVRHYDRGIVTDRCEFLYHVIETMLPNARDGKLLHLWSPGYSVSRPGWTSISDLRTIN